MSTSIMGVGQGIYIKQEFANMSVRARRSRERRTWSSTALRLTYVFTYNTERAGGLSRLSGSMDEFNNPG